jgi:hypothetical protein
MKNRKIVVLNQYCSNCRYQRQWHFPLCQKADAKKKAVYLINGSLGDNAFYDSVRLEWNISETIMDWISVPLNVVLMQANMNHLWKRQPAMQILFSRDLIRFEDQLKEIADRFPEKNFRQSRHYCRKLTKDHNQCRFC